MADAILRWQPPALVNPIIIDLNRSGDRQVWSFGDQQDVIFLPRRWAYTLPRFQILGGRHIRIIGGLWKPSATISVAAMNFAGNRGSVWLEGVHIDMAACGDRDAIGYYGGDVYLQHCRITGVTGRSAGMHGDAFQPQGNVRSLRAYRMTVSTSYQSFLLEQRLDRGHTIGSAHLEQISITRLPGGDDTSKVLYLCETETPQFPCVLRDVYAHVAETAAVRAETHYLWPPAASPVGAVRAGNRVSWPRISGYVTVGAGPDYAPAARTGINYRRAA